MMFKLSEVILENFVVFKSAHYTFDVTKNLYIITGKRYDVDADDTSNGSGKTSFIQSILWCLFGTKFRDVVNYSSNKAQVYVKLVDDSNVLEVRRTKTNSSSSVSVKYNNQMIEFDKNKDIQDYINKLLLNTTNANMFLQIINFSNQFDTNFISLSSSKKIEFIESLLDFKTLDSIYDMVNSKLRDLELEKAKLNVELNMLNEQISSMEKEISKIMNVEENKIMQIKETENKNIELKKNENTTLLTAISSLEKQKNTILDSLQSNENLLNSKGDLIKSLESKGKFDFVVFNSLHDEDTTCPVCNAPINVYDIKMNLQNKHKELIDSINKIKNDFNGLQVQHDKLSNQLSKINDSISQNKLKINQNNNEITFSKNNIIKLNELLDQQKNDKIEQLSKVKDRLNVLMVSQKNLDEDFQVYTYLHKIFHSRSSIRSELVMRYLNLLSTKVLLYLKSFDDTINDFSIKLTEKSQYNEIEIFKNGQNIDNLSEGEKTQVKIAFILSFISIFFSTYKNNLLFLFFDEVFSSLDKNSMEIALQLLKSFSSYLNIQTFIISHTNLTEDLISLADKNIVIERYSDRSDII